jgi:sugar transferase (PEP-CTERM/EpsH1 system associated)
VERTAVFHLITELDIGGAQLALLRLLASQDRDRFVPIVACLYNGDGAVAQRIRALGVPVTDLGMTAKWRWDAFVRLYRLLRRERPTILHTWMFHANLPGRVLGTLARVPIIITSRRNENIGGVMREYLNRWTSCLDDRVIAVCELARQAEIKRARVSPEHVVTVYNGVDVERFSVAGGQAAAQARRVIGIPVEAPLVGSVGRLHSQKGFSDLLTALAQVRRRIPSVRLFLAGDGELWADLEAQSRSLGLSEAVTFAGVRTDVPEILAALDVFVLPSLWEGMPNAVLEAMAAGLPVVATAVGGTPEVVVDGVTGLLVPPRDPDALARAIESLLRDPGLRRKMGQAGWKRVERCFSVEQMVRKTEYLYETLLNRGTGRHLDRSESTVPQEV